MSKFDVKPYLVLMSTSGSRAPRQRTFTSCTECRRRKQKCNQAKDRPCNNCARRYPPVLCTYEGSRLATQSPEYTNADEYFSLNPHERPTDMTNQPDHHGRQTCQADLQLERDCLNRVPDPVYLQTSQSEYGGSSAAALSSQQMYTAPQGYYPTPSTTREDYRDFASDSSSLPHTGYSSGTGDYMTGAYYQQGQMSFNSLEQDTGYYQASDAQLDNWLLPSGDPAGFIGTESTDYYYVNDEHEHSPLAPPRN